MKRMILIVLALGLCIFFVNAAWAQTTPFFVKIYAQDGAQPNYDTLHIGELAGATYGIDPGLHPAGQDSAYEYDYPPVPFGSFDVRSIDFGGHPSNTGHDLGLVNDYRTLHSNYYATDTFAIQFQPSDTNSHPGDSVSFAWDSSLVNHAGGGSWMLVAAYPYTAINPATPIIVDMTTQTSVKIPIGLSGAYTQQFYIITGDGSKFETFTYNRICTDTTVTGKWGKEPKPGGLKPAKFTCPNVNDIGDQLFTLSLTGGMTVGTDPIKSVHLKKWADVLKNSNVTSKGVSFVHQNDSSACLLYNHIVKKGVKSYYTKKQLTSLTPVYGKGTNNGLFAELMVLQVNLAASTYGSTPSGLGNVTITGATGNLA
ncbi:MAG TPA: hypothetical protein VKS81_09430, partial [Bacteroidota bacterium]|nr:hypothetical protein [Bacteroidota bacterium]